MTYAHRDDIYDADTHMMERPDWVYEFADKDIRDRLEPIVEGDKETLLTIEFMDQITRHCPYYLRSSMGFYI